MACVWRSAGSSLCSAESVEQPPRSCDYLVSELSGQLCLPKGFYCLDKLLFVASKGPFKLTTPTPAPTKHTIEFSRDDSAGVLTQLIPPTPRIALLRMIIPTILAQTVVWCMNVLFQPDMKSISNRKLEEIFELSSFTFASNENCKMYSETKYETLKSCVWWSNPVANQETLHVDISKRCCTNRFHFGFISRFQSHTMTPG